MIFALLFHCILSHNSGSKKNAYPPFYNSYSYPKATADATYIRSGTAQYEPGISPKDDKAGAGWQQLFAVEQNARSAADEATQKEFSSIFQALEGSTNEVSESTDIISADVDSVVEDESKTKGDTNTQSNEVRQNLAAFVSDVGTLKKDIAAFKKRHKLLVDKSDAQSKKDLDRWQKSESKQTKKSLDKLQKSYVKKVDSLSKTATKDFQKSDKLTAKTFKGGLKTSSNLRSKVKSNLVKKFQDKLKTIQDSTTDRSKTMDSGTQNVSTVSTNAKNSVGRYLSSLVAQVQTDLSEFTEQSINKTDQVMIKNLKETAKYEAAGLQSSVRIKKDSILSDEKKLSGTTTSAIKTGINGPSFEKILANGAKNSTDSSAKMSAYVKKEVPAQYQKILAKFPKFEKIKGSILKLLSSYGKMIDVGGQNVSATEEESLLTKPSRLIKKISKDQKFGINEIFKSLGALLTETTNSLTTKVPSHENQWTSTYLNPPELTAALARLAGMIQLDQGNIDKLKNAEAKKDTFISKITSIGDALTSVSKNASSQVKEIGANFDLTAVGEARDETLTRLLDLAKKSSVDSGVVKAKVNRAIKSALKMGVPDASPVIGAPVHDVDKFNKFVSGKMKTAATKLQTATSRSGSVNGDSVDSNTDGLVGGNVPDLEETGKPHVGTSSTKNIVRDVSSLSGANIDRLNGDAASIEKESSKALVRGMPAAAVAGAKFSQITKIEDPKIAVNEHAPLISIDGSVSRSVDDAERNVEDIVSRATNLDIPDKSRSSTESSDSDKSVKLVGSKSSDLRKTSAKANNEIGKMEADLDASLREGIDIVRSSKYPSLNGNSANDGNISSAFKAGIVKTNASFDAVTKVINGAVNDVQGKVDRHYTIDENDLERLSKFTESVMEPKIPKSAVSGEIGSVDFGPTSGAGALKVSDSALAPAGSKFASKAPAAISAISEMSVDSGTVNLSDLTSLKVENDSSTEALVNELIKSIGADNFQLRSMRKALSGKMDETPKVLLATKQFVKDRTSILSRSFALAKSVHGVIISVAEISGLKVPKIPDTIDDIVTETDKNVKIAKVSVGEPVKNSTKTAPPNIHDFVRKKLDYLMGKISSRMSNIFSRAKDMGIDEDLFLKLIGGTLSPKSRSSESNGEVSENESTKDPYPITTRVINKLEQVGFEPPSNVSTVKFDKSKKGVPDLPETSLRLEKTTSPGSASSIVNSEVRTWDDAEEKLTTYRRNILDNLDEAMSTLQKFLATAAEKSDEIGGKISTLLTRAGATGEAAKLTGEMDSEAIKRALDGAESSMSE